MRILLIAGFAMAAVTAPAFAQENGKTWVVKDTVDNCSMLPHKPGEETGLTILGEEEGYASQEAAEKAMREMDCAGIVE